MHEDLEFRRRLADHEGRFARPDRCDLDELARALAYRGRDPGAAVWRRAIEVGRIPERWADDPQRRFRATEAERRRAGITEASSALPHPPTARAALLFASDPRGLIEAEAHARELVARFEAWGCPPARRVRWRLAGNPVDRTRARAPALGLLVPAVARLRAVLGGSERIYEPPHLHRRFQVVVDALFWSRRWQAIATAEVPARVHGPQGWVSAPPALVGRTFGELRDPLEPWLALARTGYGLLGVHVDPSLGDEALIELAAPFPPPRAGAVAGERDPPRVVWSQRLTALRLACARADIGTLERELPLLPADDEPDQPRLIHFAAYGGPAALGVLASHGWLRLEARDCLDRTALMLAAGLPERGPAGGSAAEIDVPISEIVGASACAWLLAANAEPEARDRQGWTALHWAAHHHRLRCVEALIAGGAGLDVVDHRGRTPMMLAMRSPSARGLDEVVERLLTAGADPDLRDDHGWTALHHLAAGEREGHRALARRLVERGARPSRDRGGHSPADLWRRYERAPRAGGPFDPSISVAAGPGVSAPVIEAALLDGLLDELVPALPDPAKPTPISAPNMDNWLVWADWLQSRGDARGELVATSLACARVGARKRRNMRDALERLELRTASLRRAALERADPLAAARPTPLRVTWTHGFMTAAEVSSVVRSSSGPGLGPADVAAAAIVLLRSEPLLAELRIAVDGAASWALVLDALREQELGYAGLGGPAPRLRRLVLANLPARLPALDGLAKRFGALRELWLIGASKIHSGEVRWPGPSHLRIRHATTSEWSRGIVELELELPDLTHLDLALPLGGRTSPDEIAGGAQTLARLGDVQHLRLGPLTQDFAAAILPLPSIAGLRTLELDRVRGSALETLVHRADLLGELARVRVSITPVVARQRQLVVEQLRRGLPRLELRVAPGRRAPFAPWEVVSRA